MSRPPPPVPIKYPSKSKLSKPDEMKLPSKPKPRTDMLSDTMSPNETSFSPPNPITDEITTKISHAPREGNGEAERHFFDSLTEFPMKDINAFPSNSVTISGHMPVVAQPSAIQTSHNTDLHQISPVTINAYQVTLKEKDDMIKRMSITVDELTRENNALQQRVAELISCGLTVDTSTYENFTNSPVSSTSALLAAVTGNKKLIEEEAIKNQIETSQVAYLQLRVKRLEVALQLEMQSRESLEVKCAAQQKLLVDQCASHQRRR